MAMLKDSNLPLGDRKQYTFSRKTWFDHQSKQLWKIERGIVRTSILTETGNVITTGYWGMGDVVGYPLSEAQTCSIECVTSVEAWKLESEQWPLFLTDILHYGQQVETFAVIGRLERIDLRLQQFLRWMVQKFGRVIDLGYLIEVPLTHQAIAEAIGTTRVTVTRLLGQLRQEGILLPEKKHLVLQATPAVWSF
jgi:CRP-like cAMP-binding protein